jgi:hypothetical protein
MNNLPVSLKDNIMDILSGSSIYWRKKFNIVLVDIREFHILHFIIKRYLHFYLPNQTASIISSIFSNTNKLLCDREDLLLSLWNKNYHNMAITKLYSYHRDKRRTSDLTKNNALYYKNIIDEIDIFMKG